MTLPGAPFATVPLFNSTIASRGWIAVDLFFVLSGFVLMLSQGDGFNTVTWRALRTFGLRRFFRIYPLATVVLFLIALLVLADPAFVAFRRSAGHPLDFTALPFFGTLLLATRWLPVGSGEWNEPVWSLSVEVIGYVAFPWLSCLFLRMRRFATALLTGSLSIAGLVCLSACMGKLESNDITSWSIVRMSFCFIGGMALAHAWRLLSDQHPRWAGPLAGGASLVLVSACSVSGCMIVVLPAIAALIFALPFGQGLICRALSSRSALWLGCISFPLYLVHVLPLFWLQYILAPYPLSRPALFVVSLLYGSGCLLVAHVLHILVERPSHRFALWIGSTATVRNGYARVPAVA